MIIEKCDNCRKTIKSENSVHVRVYYQATELCVHCAEPVLKVLEGYNLVEELPKEYAKARKRLKV
jgi:hypothetical protein